MKEKLLQGFESVFGNREQAKVFFSQKSMIKYKQVM
jgi:hypothetical protein